MIYTDFDAIARRLRGRLRIQDTQPLVLGGQTVDPDLVKQFADQVEEYINLMLGHIYEMPLQNKHPYLADVAECLIIGKIMETHFQGTQMAVPAADVGGMAMDLTRQGERKLQLLLPQERRTDPSIPPQAEPMVLPNEIVRIRTYDSITRNVTMVADRNWGGAASRIYWPGLDDPGGCGCRARGAEPLWSGRRYTE